MPLHPVVNSVMMASHYSMISGPGVGARLELPNPYRDISSMRDLLAELGVDLDAGFVTLGRLEDMLAVAARAQICPGHFFQEGS